MTDKLRDDLSNYDKDAYEKPSVTVDVCICSIIGGDLKVLLIKRKNAPYRDRWAIPGGFLDIDKNESLEATALRELKEETHVDGVYLEQLKSYGDPERDPRMRVITVSYFALVPHDVAASMDIHADDDAKDAMWFSLRNLPDDLAFDHGKILSDLLERLVGKISYLPIAFSLVPKTFTLMELQKVYEAVLGRDLHTGNFQRKIRSQYKLRKTSRRTPTGGRPSNVFTYRGWK